ncbi:helix-turn-helix domain-containing protein [Bacillus kexueae]|uniref:helix-turn-helix domain-containing protein n=1 Tax=Aeribacillus kexueae TaxID=2078952 RepID=UPI001FAEF29E|nr:helix-turn-helix domain-containing protein [Bacillus kexueae]
MNIYLSIEKSEDKNFIINWLSNCMNEKMYTFTNISSEANLAIIEIRQLFDWLKISRLGKKNKNCKVIVILDPSLLKTSPLALDLGVQDILVKPLRKSHFVRKLKKVMERMESIQVDTPNYHEMYEEMETSTSIVKHHIPFEEAFLRRLLRGEVASEHEIIETKKYLPKLTIPNVVIFIQGFVKNLEKREKEGWHPSVLIRHHLESRFSEIGHDVSFLTYRKHLVLLAHVPSIYMRFKDWLEGEKILLDCIESLISDYSIYLFIGVGTIYREPIQLHHSYREGRKARRTPPFERLSLRYYDDITKNDTISKCTSYIMNHFHEEDLTVSRVAKSASISVPYFCRLFKQETGRSFVEYVTFVRLQHAVWQLRHTNKTIEQISDELGFNTPNYFSSTFKKYAGFSPSEYRATEEILFI